MKELKLIFFSIVVTIVVLPFGLLFNIYNSLREMFYFRFSNGIKHFTNYWIRIYKQTLVVIRYIFYHIAVAFDYLWNSTSGELFEQLLTTEEHTLYGEGDVTISTSTGYVEVRGTLTKKGKWFSKLLNKFFQEKAHCVDSYKRYLKNKEKTTWNY